MEKDIKVRGALRSLFSKKIRQVEDELSKEERDFVEVRALMGILEKKHEELLISNSKIYDALIENATQDAIEKELDDSGGYDLKLYRIKEKVLEAENRMKVAEMTGCAEADCKAPSVQSNAPTENKRPFKLPQLELKKFSGELKEWLPFWSQFKKIDEDPLIDNGDKFQYLIQATVPGSKARELVESFPAIRENYVKVIQCLKNRYGRDDLLVEVYIRDLLSLVLQNTLSSTKITVSSLYDKLECQLRALETLQVTTDRCAAMLMPLVESCLPEDILRVWQRSNHNMSPEPNQVKNEESGVSRNSSTSKYRLEKLMHFLRTEVENEQKIKLALSGFDLKTITEKGEDERRKERNRKPLSYNKNLPTAAGLLTADENINCLFCEKNHNTTECTKAARMSPIEKKKILYKKRCCYNCLKIGHHTASCWNKTKCQTCGRKHHVMICDNLKKSASTLPRKEIEENKSEVTSMHVRCDKVRSNTGVSCKVILQTFLVKLRGKNGERITRAIMDTASQRSYILRDTATDMGYKPTGKEKIQHALFGGLHTNIIDHDVYTIHLSDMSGRYYCQLEVLDQTMICGKIDPIPAGPWLQELQQYDIHLTDFEAKPVEILIGADVAGKLLTGKRQELTSGLVAVETNLGWTLMGRIPGMSKSKNLAMVVTSLIVKEADISELWSLDALGITDPSEKKRKQELQAEAEEHFLKTVTIDNAGRYSVHLPWIDRHPPLPSNYNIALKRLESTTKKLKSDGLYDEYEAVFEEWIQEGIIEEVPDSDLDKPAHYLPHRHVVKPNSTTQIRPVFDASAKAKDSPSLNNCLEKGINLIELIPSTLLRFRTGKIGVIADIRKAFLQISLCHQDRNFLRFLWYDQKKNLKAFRHRRVVFGVSCSPFLLGSVIQYHLRNKLRRAEDGDGEYSAAVLGKLMNSFYVDNCVTSVNDEQELRRFIEESVAVMNDAKFELRGWEYTGQHSSDDNDLANVLGMCWNRQSDTLEVNLMNFNSFDASQITKRSILSATHRIFDPIGVTCPVLLLPKILLQRIWSLKIGWDQPVDENIQKQFLNWVRDLTYLEQIKIPRWLVGASGPVEHTLHVFCDASQSAYAAVVFLRTEGTVGVNVQLIQAKSRVSPISKLNKRMTIPRLELLAANIGVRLYESIVKDLNIDIKGITFWSDSSTVLAWIKREEQWDVFIRNRVKEIRERTTRGQWRYIPGVCNPADLPSRGCGAKKLLESQWWRGPSWLRESKHVWPSSEPFYDEEEINKEKKRTVTSSSALMCTNDEDDWYYRYFSKYKQIIRLIAWIMRFKQNCTKEKVMRQYGELTVDEIMEAENKILYLIQRDSFRGDSNELSKLRSYMGEDGLIRLKTKVSYGPYAKDFCYPIVLPHNHLVVHRLICEIHVDSSHAGKQTMMTILRRRFWILGGRKGVKNVLNNCVICKRYTAKRIEVQSPPLPIDRIRIAKIFEIIGIDFAGPIYIKGGGRAWICLFTCAVYRAVHLELISSLSTDRFLLCLRKFISRRGRPKTIYTDNGTNFVGAANALSRIDWEKINTHSATMRIRWKFNPPTAAWWGGWWERLIGLLKQLLRRTLGRTSLDFEEMETILCECEAVINARPLTYISEDSTDLTPLTPDMFLKEIEECGVPDLDAVEKTDFSRRMNHRKQLRQTLRERFHSEYLGQLALHTKRISPKKIEVGELVLIGNENTKRLNWPLARVEELIPDREAVVRLVKLRTTSGTVLRPVQRIFPLEVQFVQSSEEQNAVQQLSQQRSSNRAGKEDCDRIGTDPRQLNPVRHTRSGRPVRSPMRMDI